MKKKHNSFCIISFISLFLSLAVFNINAKDYSPEEIINPNLANRNAYLADPENLVGAETKQQVNALLSQLREKTSAEVVMAVVPSIGDYTIEDFSEKIFTSWGIGKSDKDNGVLILIVPEQRMVRITTGYGVEGVLPDISAKKIIDRSVIPYMKEGNLDGAVAASALDVANVLTDPEAAEELKSSQKDAWENQALESDITTQDIINFALLVAVFLFICSCLLIVYDIRRTKGKERFEQANYWHERRISYILLAIGSLGLGLIPFLIAEHKRKRTRNKPLQCPHCHSKMVKLNEEEDNRYLNPAQDLEEKLNTVDYDVWLCPECGSVERFPFRQRQSEYTECPNCHTVAYHLVRDHTVLPATTRSSGIGEKIYECKYCHNRNSKRYKIPPRQDARNAAIAGAAIGALGRRGGFGGGGNFGGGFGGGATGGGGASGRW